MVSKFICHQEIRTIANYLLKPTKMSKKQKAEYLLKTQNN